MSLEADGMIDSWFNGELRGWVWCPSVPESLVEVEIVGEDGVSVVAGPADRFRGDLADAGKRAGRCGYQLALPTGTASGAYHVFARLGDARVLLSPDALLHDAPEPPPAPLDARLGDGTVARGWLDKVGPDEIVGWMHNGSLSGSAVPLELVVDGKPVAQAAADGWRTDLEDHFQGNGRAGFRLPIPAHLRDGERHRIEMRRTDTGAMLTAAPLVVPLERGAPANPEPPAPAPVRRPPADATIELSVIVNMYDMPREAERTLMSLSRRFQDDIETLAYEVICIDNGSMPPLATEAVTRHGPEFRLWRPEQPHPSPVFALNEAARQARGRFVALMIDGAHLLSPGVLASAMSAFREKGADTIVAARHWFIGGDQRWLSAVGYERELEDLAFARIGWPDCGYDIFKISAPIHDTPNTWFDSMSESNCLFLSTDAFRALGGYDESFVAPGAGFANLDLFARAARRPGAAVTALIGEATFHQYHGGTTTNVSDAEKERRVRRYASDFFRERGASFEPVRSRDITVQGRISSQYALNARQRPSSKVRLGLTTSVRPQELASALDEGARAALQTAYVETGGHRRSIWAGQPTGVAPADLLELQQVLWTERPDVLVLKDVAPGLLAFVQSILPAIALEGLRLVWVTRGEDAPTPAGTVRVTGDAVTDGATRDALDDAVGAAERISVIFQPRDDEPLPVAALQHFASLVSTGGYLIVLSTAFAQPGLGYASRWTNNAVHRFLATGSPFRVDRTMNAHFVTTCPSGFLRRLLDPTAVLDDDRLDVLDGAEIL